MCGISGAYFYDSRAETSEIHDIILRCSDRGRDSCGVVTWGEAGWSAAKCLGGPENLQSDFLPPTARIVISSNRAEPTTEWVRRKSASDIPPFQSDSTAVSHNGVIANDIELAKIYEIDAPSPIDSAILPSLIDKLGVSKAISVLKGGFALAILDSENRALHLYRNFLPLAVAWRPGVYYFSSEQKNLPEGGIGGEYAVENIPPFSGVSIESTGRMLRWS